MIHIHNKYSPPFQGDPRLGYLRYGDEDLIYLSIPPTPPSLLSLDKRPRAGR